MSISRTVIVVLGIILLVAGAVRLLSAGALSVESLLLPLLLLVVGFVMITGKNITL